MFNRIQLKYRQYRLPNSILFNSHEVNRDVIAMLISAFHSSKLWAINIDGIVLFAAGLRAFSCLI